MTTTVQPTEKTTDPMLAYAAELRRVADALERLAGRDDVIPPALDLGLQVPVYAGPTHRRTESVDAIAAELGLAVEHLQMNDGSWNYMSPLGGKVTVYTGHANANPAATTEADR